MGKPAKKAAAKRKSERNSAAGALSMLKTKAAGQHKRATLASKRQDEEENSSDSEFADPLPRKDAKDAHGKGGWKKLQTASRMGRRQAIVDDDSDTHSGAEDRSSSPEAPWRGKSTASARGKARATAKGRTAGASHRRGRGRGAKRTVRKSGADAHSHIFEDMEDDQADSQGGGQPIYDKAYCKCLEVAHPTRVAHGPTAGMVHVVNSQCPLVASQCKMSTAGCVYSMALSADGQVLATAGTLGIVSLWDLTTSQLVLKLRDTAETEVDEFFVVCFSPDNTVLLAAGKRKNRHMWSDNDEDNAILPCHIKLFDVATGQLVGRLEGHTEEVQCLRVSPLKGSHVLLSASQDGSIRCWSMADDWRSSTGHSKLEDNVTCMAFDIAILPGCGGKYCVAACDKTLKLYDLETKQLVQTFDDLYSSYCDCVVVVEGPTLPVKDEHHWLVTRGVEDVVNDMPSRQNRVILHQLVAPSTKRGKWMLEESRYFTDMEFHANSYLCRLASNGMYVVAPTVTGKAFVWNVATGTKVAVLSDGRTEREIRDIVFNPCRPQLLLCGDDGVILSFERPKENVAPETRQDDQ